MTSTRPISVVAGAVAVTGILANTLVAPVLPDIERAFDASAAQLGAVVALASLPGLVLAPVIGVLADRVGRRAVLLPCLLVFGLGGFVGMLAPSMTVLLAARLFQGAGAAGLVNLAIVILGDTFSGRARTQAIGRNAAVLTVGLALSPLTGGLLSAVGGWRLAFAPYLLALPIALAVRVTLPPDRPSERVTLRAQLAGTAPYLRTMGAVAMIVAGFCAFFLVFGLALTTMPLHLDREFGVGAAGRGLVLGIPAAASVVLSLRIGALTARFGSWPLIIAGFLVWAVSYTIVGLAPVLPLVLLAVLLWGVGEAFTIVTLQAYAAEVAPAGQRGTVVAVWVAGVRAGQGTGPLVAGNIVGTAGTSTVFLYGAGFAAAVAATLATARARIQRSARRAAG